MRTISSSAVSFQTGMFKPNSFMTEKLPKELKKRILDYLNSQPACLIGDVPLRDPVTGRKYALTNVIREKDGFEWSL